MVYIEFRHLVCGMDGMYHHQGLVKYNGGGGGGGGAYDREDFYVPNIIKCRKLIKLIKSQLCTYKLVKADNNR